MFFFFHKIACMRYKKNVILRLQSQGKIIEDKDQIKGIINEYFKNIFNFKVDQRWPGSTPDDLNQWKGLANKLVDITKLFF